MLSPILVRPILRKKCRIPKSISNTTKVYSKAMEKHFFLLPPCAVVATTVAFQEKGNFSCPFLGFHIYFKIPIASLALEKRALPWPAPFAAFVVTITYRGR